AAPYSGGEVRTGAASLEARIGVDIGGSGVRAGLVEDGRVVRSVCEALPERSVEGVVATVARAVDRLGVQGPVGVGVPGFVHRQAGIASPNFPAWRDVPFGDVLAQRLGRSVFVENDANCATLGIWRERGRPEHLVALTLGTGVGGGVISEGRLLRGARGTGAELGHIYAGGDAPCGCGGIGCLEQWCGTVGLRRVAVAAVLAVVDGGVLVVAAERGWVGAAQVLRRAAEGLGRGLVTLVNVFNSDVVVIAGGLARADAWLAPPSEAWLR